MRIRNTDLISCYCSLSAYPLHPAHCTLRFSVSGVGNPADAHSKVGSRSSLGRYVFGSEISYNKPPPRLPGLGC